MKLKKLNKKQKDLLKKSLLKGLNITCYVVTGLTLLLATIIGLKSCSSNNKNQSVATTPVVSDVITDKNKVDGVYPQTEQSLTDLDKLYSYAQSYQDVTYSISEWRGSGNDDGDFPNFVVNKFIAKAVYRDGSNAPLCHLSGRFDFTYDQSEPEIYYVDKDLSSIHLDRFSSGLPVLTFTYLDGSTYLLDTDYLSTCAYGGLWLDFRFDYNSAIFYSFTSENYIAITSDYQNSVKYALDEFFYFFDASTDSDVYTINADYNLNGFIYPYVVYGNAYTDGVMKIEKHQAGGSSLVQEPWLSLKRYPTQYVKLFKGYFSCNGSYYNEIIAEYGTYNVRSYFNDYGTEYLYLSRIFYKNNNGNTLDVVVSHNSLQSYYAQTDPTTSLIGQGMTWNFVKSEYRYIHIYYAMTRWSYANVYPISYYTPSGGSNNPTAYLDRVFSTTGNGANTIADGSTGGSSIPVYDDVPTSYAFGSVFGLISMAFGALSNFLQVQILPGLSLGTLFFIPLVVMIIIFIVWLVKR